MLWRVMKDCLPTKTKLSRAIPIQDHCPFCDQQGKSSLHLFKECSFSRAIWFGTLGIQTDTIQADSSFAFGAWILKISKATGDIQFITECHCLIESLWGYRNNIDRRGITANPRHLMEQIHRMQQEYLISLSKTANRTRRCLT